LPKGKPVECTLRRRVSDGSLGGGKTLMMVQWDVVEYHGFIGIIYKISWDSHTIIIGFNGIFHEITVWSFNIAIV
jgi:hypothetical protein